MARARSADPARRERLLSHTRLLQAGSAAAAIGSILALAFTVGDRVTALLGDDSGKPRVHIDGVDVEVMKLRTFLETTKGDDPSVTSEYPPEDLDSDVLTFAVRANYENSSKGAEFDARQTLERRDADGPPDAPPKEVVETRPTKYFLHDDYDLCVCQDFFYLPPRARSEYRVVVEIRRNGAPKSHPLDRDKSEWYSPD